MFITVSRISSHPVCVQMHLPVRETSVQVMCPSRTICRRSDPTPVPQSAHSVQPGRLWSSRPLPPQHMALHPTPAHTSPQLRLRSTLPLWTLTACNPRTPCVGTFGKVAQDPCRTVFVPKAVSFILLVDCHQLLANGPLQKRAPAGFMAVTVVVASPPPPLVYGKSAQVPQCSHC